MDGDVLAYQLGELGRQLDEATTRLAELDILATGKGIEAAKLKEDYEDALADAFLASDGAVEAKKAQARVLCMIARKIAQSAAGDAEMAKADVRNQQAMVRAINSRIDIGRSLLSREKTLAVLS